MNPNRYLDWRVIPVAGALFFSWIFTLLSWRHNDISAGTTGRFEGRSSGIHRRANDSSRFDRLGAFNKVYSYSSTQLDASITLSDFISSGTNLRLSQKGISNASTALTDFLKFNPDEDAAWENLAWIYALNGNDLKSDQALNQALKISHDDYSYYVLSAGLAEYRGKLDAAEDKYAHALILYPRLLTSVFWRKLQSRRPQLALHAVEQAKNMAERSSIGTELSRIEAKARLLYLDGQIQDATFLVVGLNDKVPNLSGMWELHGKIAEKQGDLNDAAIYYRRAIFLDPTDPLPWVDLASVELAESSLDDSAEDAFQGWRLSKTLHSPSARRRAIQYQQNSGPRIGILPDSLMMETQPSIDFKSLFNGISLQYRLRNNASAAAKMAELAEQATEP
jgi:Tfp pilus assembly protein PilF